MALQRIAGLKRLSRDGLTVQCLGELTIQTGTAELAPLNGPDGFHGVKVEKKEAFFEVEIVDRSDVDLIDDLAAGTGELLIAEMESGKTYALFDADFAGPATTGSEGKVKAKWLGERVVEL